MNVVIIGAGAIGKAVGHVLTKVRKNKIEYWDAVPGTVKRQKQLEKIIPSADVVFFCLPSSSIRDAVGSIFPYLKKRTTVVCLAKGIEDRSRLTMDRLLTKILPRRQPFALLFGPMLAVELSAGTCGHAVVAGYKPARNAVTALFAGTRLSVSSSDDLAGVAACGALKNVYAIGLGIVSALWSGDNIRGSYVVVAREEMERFIILMGGRRETANSFAGLGDLLATGLNPTSKNHQVGRALVKKRGGRAHTEGARSAATLTALLGKRINKFPLFNSLHLVLVHGASPQAVTEVICSSK